MRFSSLLQPSIFGRTVASIPAALAAGFEAPFSHLFIKAEGSGWVLDEEAKSMLKVIRDLGIKADRSGVLSPMGRQCVHYTSQFVVKDPRWTMSKHRLSVDYFHGLPGNDPLFAKCFERVKELHPRLSRIRVSHRQIEELILSTGIDPAKVHRIPIGIELSYFRSQTIPYKMEARKALAIPVDATVIGSFQKDGVGWGEGFDPKYIKGPDVFVNVAKRLKQKFPRLHVLLTGPSRGFVKKELSKAGIPFTHHLLDHYCDIGRYYDALDLYVITSRDEGGPKAILESMASNVPLITTRVGQARDLVRHRENAWMVESEDEEGLTYWADYALKHPEEQSRVREAARLTAEQNSYSAQRELWRKFFHGYVEG